MNNLKQNMAIPSTVNSNDAKVEKPKEYDYLDFEDNERRLEQLKTQNDLNRFKSLLDSNAQKEDPFFDMQSLI